MLNNKNWNQIKGEWEGTKKIFLQPGELHSENTSRAIISSRLNDSFLLMEYTHIYENKEYEGILLIGYIPKIKRYQGSWIDSWHMKDEIMQLEGESTDGGILLHGSYAGEGAIWGWDIELKYEGDIFNIIHYNITPDGLKGVGVEMEFKNL